MRVLYRLTLLTLVVFACTQAMAAGLSEADDSQSRTLDASSYSSLAKAVAAIGSKRATLTISSALRVNNNLTIPANITLRVTAGGLIRIATGKTLTILSRPEAPPAKWFDNALARQGTVVISSAPEAVEVYPDWWADNTTPGTTDMSAAIQAAINSGANRVRFLDSIYKNLTVSLITASNIELLGSPNTTIYTVRATPMNDSWDGVNPSPTIKLSYAFEISGDVNQTNVSIRNLRFTGSGYWGGIYSSLLYPHDGWGPGGYPNVDFLAYTTTRTNCKITDLYFNAPYYEAMALTCVSVVVDNVKIDNGVNFRNNGNLVVRYTRNAIIRNIVMEGCQYKNLNTSYVDGLTISNVIIKNAIGGADGAGIYIGHFSRNVALTNYTFDSPAPFDLFLKVSYNATNVAISNCTLNGAGYIMLQAVQYLTMSNVLVRTTGPLALQLSYSNSFPPSLSPANVHITGCTFISTADGSVAPRVVDLSYGTGTSFENNKVVGNVYANPARDTRFSNNDVYYNSTYEATEIRALFFQNFTGGGTSVISGNRIETTMNSNTVYLNGAVGAANIEFTNNTFSHNSIGSYGVVANYMASGRFLYVNNNPFGSQVQLPLYVNYTDASQVTVRGAVQELTTSGAIVSNEVFLAASAPTAFTLRAPVTGDTIHIVDTSAAAVTQTVVLPPGVTWDGVHRVAVFDAQGKALYAIALSPTRWLVMNNVGAVTFN